MLRHFDIYRPVNLPYQMAIGLKEGMGPEGGGRIPPELVKALKRSSSSLLIKGLAGTGKTTLALTILRTFNLKNDFLFLSTRASPSHVINDHMWLKDWLGDQDNTKEKGPRDPYLPPLFVDARLDEPTQLFEKITNQLMDARSPLIIVDTWDSLKELEKKEPLEADMRVLLAWCERAHAKLIVICEDPRDVSLDALLDGVVILNQKEQEGGRARELLLPKLRGIEIRNPSYLFTLKGSIFHSFEQYHPNEFATGSSFSARRGRLEVVPGYYSTGFQELDNLLDGGVQAGTLANVELSIGVDPRIVLFLLANMIVDFAVSNRDVLMGSIEGLEESFVDSFLKGLVPRAKLKHIRLLQGTNGDRDSGGSLHEGGERADSADRLEATEQPRLSILGTQILEQERGRRRQTLDGFARSLRTRSGLGVVVTRPTERRISEHLYAIAGIRMKISSINGVLLLQPDVRLPRLLAFDISRESGIPILGLQPIE
jgi:KaiC/GvpD/RAD55 family RecA-like ATPase